MHASRFGFALSFVVAVAACGGSSFESTAADGTAGAAGTSNGAGGSAGATAGGTGGTSKGGTSNGGSSTAGAGGDTNGGTSSGGSSGGPSGGTSNGGSAGGPSGGTSNGGSAGGPSGGKSSGGGTVGGASGGPGGGAGGSPACLPGATECVGNDATRTCMGGVWSPPMTCPVPPGGCGAVSCQDGVCGAAVAVPPPDPPHDCKSIVCSGGTYSTQPDLKDLPAPLGACDDVACSVTGPLHQASDAKCPAIRSCDPSSYSCVCRTCPAGTVAGLPGNECAMTKNKVTATASSSAMTFEPSSAVDNSASTRWSSGTDNAELTLDVPALAMSAIVVWPAVVSSAAIPVTIDWTIDVTDAAGKVSTYVTTVKYTGGDPPSLKLQLNAPIVVEKIVVKGKCSSLTWGVFEVTYMLCQ